VENEYGPIVEALLFAAGKPVSAGQIAEVLEVEESAVPEIVGALSEALDGRGLHVVELAGGYQLGTRPAYSEYLNRMRTPEPEKLTRAALETLSIVAYRQPITRPEVDAIRGVQSSGVLASLTEKGLVRIAGRKRAPGRPLLFDTTEHFLSSFGLKDLDDLPMLDALRTAATRQPTLDDAPDLDGDEATEPPEDEPEPDLDAADDADSEQYSGVSSEDAGEHEGEHDAGDGALEQDPDRTPDDGTPAGPDGIVGPAPRPDLVEPGSAKASEE